MIERMELARHLVREVGDLPPLPTGIANILKTLNDPQVTVSRLQKQVLLDEALTAMLLKTANSAFYGMSNQVRTVSHAIELLGFDTVRTILLAYLTHRVFSVGNKLILNVLWKHSASTAVFARRIATQNGKISGEEAFIAALLHDIGKGVLLRNQPAGFAAIVERISNERVASTEAEQQALGFTHLEVGYLLIRKWNFPETLIEALVYHHDAVEFSGRNPLVPLTSLANKLSHLYNYSFSPWFEGWEQDIPEAGLLGLDMDDLQEICRRAEPEIREILGLFETGTQ
jgi:putative nucleotidyltransferase with HDIG domain